MNNFDQIVKGGDKRDYQRRVNERGNQHRLQIEIVEVQRDYSGEDVSRGCDLSKNGRPERARAYSQIDDGDRQDDGDVAAEHENGEPEGQAVGQSDPWQR